MGRVVEQKFPVRHFSNVIEITLHPRREEEKRRGNKLFTPAETLINL